MLFKDFEIRPYHDIKGEVDPKRFEVVKWVETEPREVVDGRTGQKKISTRFCFVVAWIWWNNKEPCWEFESVGTRFLEYYEEGLCEFIRKWLELTNLTRRFTEECE